MAFLIPKTDVHRWIQTEFPNLQTEPYAVTSLYTDEYNCIGWSANDTDNWWWPSEYSYWPEGLPLVDSVENFILAFRTLNYEPCDDGNYQVGYEKVVVYRGNDGRVKHMARQLDATKWTSKLGSSWDIEHQAPQGIECKTYGTVAQYMRRLTRSGDGEE